MATTASLNHVSTFLIPTYAWLAIVPWRGNMYTWEPMSRKSYFWYSCRPLGQSVHVYWLAEWSAYVTKGLPNSWIRLIVACPMTASGWFPSMIPTWSCYSGFLAICSKQVWAFLATKSFAAGSSMYPCHMACVSKSFPRDVISSSNCCPQWHRSAVDVMHICWGWSLSIPFLCSSGFLRLVLMTSRQSGVSRMRHLKCSLPDSSSVWRSPFFVLLLLVASL